MIPRVLIGLLFLCPCVFLLAEEAGQDGHLAEALRIAGDCPALRKSVEPLCKDPCRETFDALKVASASCEAPAAAIAALFLDDANDAVRVLAAETLAELVPERGGQALVKLLGDGNPYVRMDAAQALSARGGSEALPHLQKLLRDPDVSVREQAASLIVTREGESRIVGFLAHQDPLLRSAATQALGLRGEAASIPQIRAMLADPCPDVRAEAAYALARFPDKSLVSVLAPLLDDPASKVQDAAVESLEHLSGEKWRKDGLLILPGTPGKSPVMKARAWWRKHQSDPVFSQGP